VRDDRYSDEALRSAFRALVDEADGAGGPDAGRVWDAALGASSVAERRTVVDEIARRPGAALSWRLARALQSELEPTVGREITPLARRAGARRLVHRAAWAAAAALVFLIGTWAIRSGPTASTEAPIYRDPEQGRDPDRMRAETAQPALDHGRFLLRWSPAAEGARYDAQVMTESLIEVASARDLDRPELVVVPSALRAIAPGSRILWQVTARLPSGAEVRSETFVSVIQ
jgi:hypothetical protein